MRLSDHLAARRRLYSIPLITAPSLLVIDIPRRFAGDGLALGRYYPVVIETTEELAEFEAFLDAERPTPRPPDLLDRRASNRDASGITFFEFTPPEADWPWMLLCHWPRCYAAVGANDPNLLARGSYTVEAYSTQLELHRGIGDLAAALGAQADIVVVPSFVGAAGRA